MHILCIFPLSKRKFSLALTTDFTVPTRPSTRDVSKWGVRSSFSFKHRSPSAQSLSDLVKTLMFFLWHHYSLWEIQKQVRISTLVNCLEEKTLVRRVAFSYTKFELFSGGYCRVFRSKLSRVSNPALFSLPFFQARLCFIAKGPFFLSRLRQLAVKG